jgi:hypothetical protein
LTTLVWVSATLLTPAEPAEVLDRFYRKVRPDAWGWQPVAARVREIPQTHDARRNFVDWGLGCLMVYLAMFGTGRLLLGSALEGFAMLAGAGVCAVLLGRDLARRGWEDEPAPESR